jgi:hypothetical protein
MVVTGARTSHRLGTGGLTQRSDGLGPARFRPAPPERLRRPGPLAGSSGVGPKARPRQGRPRAGA